jgi:hypothetical protein
VRPALEALAPKYTLGIVSDGNSYPEDFGLEGLVALSAYSLDRDGIENLDPRNFRFAPVARRARWRTWETHSMRTWPAPGRQASVASG